MKKYVFVLVFLIMMSTIHADGELIDPNSEFLYNQTNATLNILNTSNIARTNQSNDFGNNNITADTFFGKIGTTLSNFIGYFTDIYASGTVNTTYVNATEIRQGGDLVLTAEVDGSTTNELQDLWDVISSDSGSTTANSNTDTLTIQGNSLVSTGISGDTLTISLDESNIYNHTSTVFSQIDEEQIYNHTSEVYSGIYWYNQTQAVYDTDKYVLNTGDSLTGTYEVNGGWGSGGSTLSNGDIFVQTLYAYNITGLSVDTLNINGSLIPQFDNVFDIGSSTKRYRNANLSGSIDAGSLLVSGENINTLYSDIKWAYNQTSATGWINDGTQSFLIDSNDKVGIGTSTPTHLLNVVGTSNFTDTLTLEGSTGLILDNNAGDGGNLELRSSTGNNLFIDNSGGDLRIFNATTVKLSIKDETGNVGIGTSTPTYLLHVNGNASVLNRLNIAPTSSESYIQTGDSNARLNFVTDRSDTSFVAFAFEDSGGTPSLVITDGGDVGIGTTSPASLLTLQDTAVQFNLISTGAGATQLFFHNSEGDAELRYDGDLFGFTGARVGIGTNSPTAPLQVNGKAVIGGDTYTGYAHTLTTALPGNRGEIYLRDLTSGYTTGNTYKDGHYIASDGGLFFITSQNVSGSGAGTLLSMNSGSGVSSTFISAFPNGALGVGMTPSSTTLGALQVTGGIYTTGDLKTTGTFSITTLGSSIVIGDTGDSITLPGHKAGDSKDYVCVDGSGNIIVQNGACT